MSEERAGEPQYRPRLPLSTYFLDLIGTASPPTMTPGWPP